MTPNTATQLGMCGIPELFMYKGGKIISSRAGAAPEATLQSWIEDSL